MKIKRDEKKKEKTAEEKELAEYRRAKNLGLAAGITGGAAALLGNGFKESDKHPSFKPAGKVARRVLLYGGAGLGTLGLGLHGISAVKYNKLKKKLKKEKEENDNTEEEK